MSHREENEKMEPLNTWLDLSGFREIVEMKTQAEEFLKSHSEETETVRDKQNIVLNCDYLLKVDPLSHYLDIEKMTGDVSCKGCTLDDCSICDREDF